MWQVPTKKQLNIFNASAQSLKYIIHESLVFKLNFFVYEAITHFHYVKRAVKRPAKSMTEKKLVLWGSSCYSTWQLGSKPQTWWNRGNESLQVSDVMQSLSSVSDGYRKGESICNLITTCGMNGQPVLHTGPLHSSRQSYIFVSCWSVYFNSYQILTLFVQKGIWGRNVGEADKYFSQESLWNPGHKKLLFWIERKL